MKINSYFFTILLILASGNLFGQLAVQQQDINPDILNTFWPAYWIEDPGSAPVEYGVFHFRKTFDLTEKPDEFIIHVSADNRYQLYVNGNFITYGPSRGDLLHWRFESLDISADLRKGKNVVAAVVWNAGEYRPFSQMTRQTGFILAGNGSAEAMVNTDDSWKIFRNEAYEPISGFDKMLNEFIVVGPGDRVEGKLYPWGWEKPEYDDNSWSLAGMITRGQPRNVGTNGDWMLVPRSIALMQIGHDPFEAVRRSDGIDIDVGDLQSGQDVIVDAHQQVSFLLDQGFLTKSYPRLILSQGKDAEIRFTYAEALFDDQGMKGNRNETEGKKMIGNYDIFIPDGGETRIFSPLWFRTYRYLQVDIITAGEPLLIHQLFSSPTGYPLKENSSFESDNARLSDVWKVGLRTARLCAGEIYYDCPYYEQMQYVGDTRIQALISLYVDGTDQLMRKAIELYDHSRISDGLTQSRYPSSSLQIIPPYSLFWVAMIHDYWYYRDDPGFVESFLPGIRNVLGWFEKRVDDRGMLGPLEWWNFVDWADEWPWDPAKGVGGVPYGVSEGNSSNISLQFAYALDMAAELNKTFGDDHQASRYGELSAKIKKATFDLCWNDQKGLLADSPDKTFFSQHANIFGILTDAVPEDMQKDLMNRIMQDENLIQCTLYFRFYLVQALKKTGMSDLYVDQLEPWFEMLDNGLTTFAEKPDPTRSDCHAWSASPNYDFLATVCGIVPGSPGFRTVRIKPSFGSLKIIKGKLFLPDFNDYIEVDLTRDENKVSGTVYIPEGLSGDFIWNDQSFSLRQGRQKVEY
ncbi:MAG: alpha-L-rhamnosidase [Cyclobacteriaceae bacterium]|nr:alpha-L-rhamnosidase [Cyclobacteriaceae bacterium]